MPPSMLRRLLSRTVSKENTDIDEMLHNDRFRKTGPYETHISTLHNEFPHLESLSLYMQAIERARTDRRLGSHDSDSILAAEISSAGETIYHRIDCYNHADVESYRDMLSGKGDKQTVTARILVVEDLSPAAIEALGTGFNLDPHVFYFHLGFDTRRSAMADLIDAANENDIPVTWCMPSHAPDGFISVPVPCDLKPRGVRKLECGLQEDSTYSRQSYRPIAEVPSKDQAWDPPQRAFHRLSVAFPKGDIETVIILAFPTWKRLSNMQPKTSGWPLASVIDSYGYSLVPTSLESTSPIQTSVKRGEWGEGQWERVQPLFQAVVDGLFSTSYNKEKIMLPGIIRERALVWLYSKMNHNYYLACQSEGRCWRDIRALLDTDRALGHVSQRPKRHFRDSMTKTIELLEIAKGWLDEFLEHATDQQATICDLQRKVEVTLMYEKSRIKQVLLNINDHQSEVQMDLMVLQLEENRHAIQQAMSVARLTRLAFFFVPLSTICSAFGMNLKEMDNHPTIWWFIAIALVCTLAATAVSSSIIRKLFGRTLRAPRISPVSRL